MLTNGLDLRSVKQGLVSNMFYQPTTEDIAVVLKCIIKPHIPSQSWHMCVSVCVTSLFPCGKFIGSSPSTIQG